MSDANKSSRDVSRFFVPPLKDDRIASSNESTESEEDELTSLRESAKKSGQKNMTLNRFWLFVGLVIVMASIVIARICFSATSLLWEIEPKSDPQCIVGDLIAYRGMQVTGGVRFHAEVPAYFLLELPGEGQIIVSPNGKTPLNYRGPIAVNVRRGLWTNHQQYALTPSKACVPPS